MPVHQTVSPSTGPRETDTFPSSYCLSDLQLCLPPPPPPPPTTTTTTNFSTLTLFYAELAALPMCIIPPFLLTGRENDEEDELTTTVAGTKRKLEDYHWKCYFFFSLLLITLCPPVSSFAMIQLLISATEIICSHRTNPDLDLVWGSVGSIIPLMNRILSEISRRWTIGHNPVWTVQR